MKDNIKTISKKIVKIRLIISIATTAVTVAATIYSLIPKSDKFEVIDTEALIAENTHEEADEEAAPIGELVEA